MEYNWTHLFGEQGDHRYFLAEDGRIAIADDSGRYPENTDDGVLFVDTTRPIDAFDDFFSVPLVNEDGKESRTFAGITEGLRLANLSGQTIAPNGTTELFTVIRQI